MGTSSTYTGYPNNPSKNPLIPSDFEDIEISDDSSENDSENEDNTEEISEPQNKEKLPSWKATKSQMSKVASGESKNYKGAISNYVKSSGGSKSISKSSFSGVNTTNQLGDFVQKARNQGIQPTLEEYAIQYKDRSAKDVLNDLINALAPSPNNREDSISRKALIRTMEFIYSIFDSEDINEFNFDSLDEESFNKITCTYIENYIYEKLINELGSRIEANAKDSKSAIKLENDIKFYINSVVNNALKKKDFVSFSFTRKETLSLYNQCYTVMEEQI